MIVYKKKDVFDHISIYWMWVKMANCILRNISQNIVTHKATVFCKIFRKIQ